MFISVSSLIKHYIEVFITRKKGPLIFTPRVLYLNLLSKKGTFLFVAAQSATLFNQKASVIVQEYIIIDNLGICYNININGRTNL